MNRLSFARQAGIGLIEVMLAVAVASVGLLSLSTLEGTLTSGLATDKARAEATMLAQQKLEEITPNVVVETYTALGDESETIAGKNATYTRALTLTPESDPARTKAEVTVTWTDATNTQQSVALVSNFIFRNPAQTFSEPSGGVTGGQPLVEPPNWNVSDYGAADGQPETYTPGTGTLLATEDSGETFHQYTDGDGNTLILDGDGDVLLTVFTNLITLEGQVYFDGDIDELSVLISDAGVCAFPIGQRAAAGGYTVAEYKCWTGSGWRGKVGIVGFNTNQDGICAGIARLYVRYVLNEAGDTVIRHEGIENSYDLSHDHDFLVANAPSGIDCDAEQAAAGNIDIASLIVTEGPTPSYSYTFTGEVKTRGSGDARAVTMAVVPSPVASGTCVVDVVVRDQIWTCTLSVIDNGLDPLMTGTPFDGVVLSVGSTQLGATIDIDARPADVDVYVGTPGFTANLSGYASGAVIAGPDIIAVKTGR